MITSRRLLIVLAVLFVLCGLAGLGVFAFRQQLGLSLTAPTPKVFLTNTPVVVSLPATKIPATSTALTPTMTPLIPTVTPTISSGSFCGETVAWNILVLGSDLNETSPLRGSDLTRMMRVDFPNQRVIVYALPRALWVDTTGLGLTNPNIYATQLGLVFYEGRIRSPQFGVREIMVDGLRVSAATILRNFSIQTDHYLALDLNQLPAIVDAVGGIPIDVPERTTDFWRPFVIEAGSQILNGEQTANYSRAFMGSDFDRIRRNEILLEAIRQKLLDPTVWSQIPSLYNQFSAVIVTDFTPEQITHLACLLKQVGSNGILQDSVRPEWTWSGPRESLLWNKNYVLSRIHELGFTP